MINYIKRFYKTHPILSFIIIIDIFLIIFLTIFFIIHISNVAFLKINVAPIQSTVKIDDKICQQDLCKISAKQKHHIIIEAKGFQSKSFDISLNKGETGAINNYLMPLDHTFSYYLKDTNQKDLRQLTNISPKLKKDQLLQNFTQKASILLKLPYTYSSPTLSFSLTRIYSKACQKIICLNILSNNISNSDLFHQVIQNQLGYSLSDYKLSFTEKVYSFDAAKPNQEPKSKKFNRYHIYHDLPLIYAKYDQNYNYSEFRIDAGKFKKCKRNFCLKVTDTTGNNLENAKQLLREKSYDPLDYEIIYKYKPIQALE